MENPDLVTLEMTNPYAELVGCKNSTKDENKDMKNIFVSIAEIRLVIVLIETVENYVALVQISLIPKSVKLYDSKK